MPKCGDCRQEFANVGLITAHKRRGECPGQPQAPKQPKAPAPGTAIIPWSALPPELRLLTNGQTVGLRVLGCLDDAGIIVASATRLR